MFFRKKTFRERAFKSVEREMARCLTPAAATEALSAFVGILRVDTEKYGMDIDALAQRWEREFRKPEAFGLSLVDHVVSQMKIAQKTEGDVSASPWARLIALLEGVLDANPGVIIPRNGRIGRLMASPEMERFVSNGSGSSSNLGRAQAELKAALSAMK